MTQTFFPPSFFPEFADLSLKWHAVGKELAAARPPAADPATHAWKQTTIALLFF